LSLAIITAEDGQF